MVKPSLRLLTLADALDLQLLFEACSDYWLFAEGQEPGPHAGQDEFSEPPNAASTAKHVFGVTLDGKGLVAMVEALRDYPACKIWYLGLMLVEPDLRSTGLGAAVYAAFELLVRAHEGAEIRLCVFDEGARARKFWERQGFTLRRQIPSQQFGSRWHSRTKLKKIIPPNPH